MIVHRRTGLLASLIMLAVALSPLVPVAPRAAAQDARPQVVASFGILADVAQNVAGDAADVTSLIPVGGNPHAYTPSARDVATLSDADLVLTVGVNFEEGLLPVVNEAAADHQVVVSECVPIHAVQAAHEHEDADHEDEHIEAGVHADAVNTACDDNLQAVAAAFGMDEAALTAGSIGPLYALECPGDEDHEHEADDEEHEHEAGSCDPHVWMDPANVALWTLTIRDALSTIDPANADLYAANADSYLAQLAGVNDEAAALLSAIPEEKRMIVTNHLAFGYLASRYGLDVVGVVIPSASTNAEPSAQDVVALIQTIEDHGVPAIFTESMVSPDLAQQVADETGAQIVQLYTGSLSAPGGDAATYLDYTRYNVTTIANALQ